MLGYKISLEHNPDYNEKITTTTVTTRREKATTKNTSEASDDEVVLMRFSSSRISFGELHYTHISI